MTQINNRLQYMEMSTLHFEDIVTAASCCVHYLYRSQRTTTVWDNDIDNLAFNIKVEKIFDENIKKISISISESHI